MIQIRHSGSIDKTSASFFAVAPASSEHSSTPPPSLYFTSNSSESDTIDAKDLFLAAQHGSSLHLKELLKQLSRDQINELDERVHLTPLMAAVLEGHTEKVQVLLEDPNIDVHKKSNFGDTAFDLAVKARHIDIALEILNHQRLPEKAHKEKLKEFSDQILENVKQKIEKRYKILEDMIARCFDWLEIRQNICETLELYSQTQTEIRHDRCQLRRSFDRYDQMILFGKHKGQKCLTGSFKTIKPLQFFILFNLANFQIHSVNLEVMLTAKSHLLSFPEKSYELELERDGFLKETKISKSTDKPPRILYRKINHGMNLRSFIYGLEPTPFLLDDSLKKEIVICILKEFFLNLDRKKPLNDLKLDNMAIRIENHKGRTQPVVAFVDTIDIAITTHLIPLSFLNVRNLSTFDSLSSDNLLPFIQSIVACMTVLLGNNAVYKTDVERASTVAVLNEIVSSYAEEKTSLFKEALAFVLNPGRFCKTPKRHLTTEFLHSEINDYSIIYKQKTGNSFDSL